MASKPAWAERIAEERIAILFEEAADRFDEDRALADRYVEIARNIAMRFNLSIPKKHRESFCSSCYAALKPGTNARIRVDGGEKTVTCMACGETARYPYRD